MTFFNDCTNYNMIQIIRDGQYNEVREDGKLLGTFNKYGECVYKRDNIEEGELADIWIANKPTHKQKK